MNFSVNAILRTLALWLFLACGTTNAQAANDAVFVSQSVPSAMLAGSVYTVSVTMSNTGNATWTTAASYALGSQNPENNSTWGTNRIALPSSIVPGGQATFSFQVTAPSTPGTYSFQWRVVQDGVEWFGVYTPSVAVTVSAPVNGANVISATVPTAMTQGQSYAISVTMQNTGNTTWPTGAIYRLGSTNPQNTLLWGVNRVNLNSAVSPGQQYTFSFNVVAPAAGSYTMGWGMVQENVAWFGPTSNSAVTVSAAGPPKPTISVARTPSPMTSGQSYSLSWSSTNATSVSRVCTASGTGYTVSDSPALSGTSTGTASAAWVGYPSVCTWTATGAGGTATFNETMTTTASSAPAPTMSVARTPSPMTAGQSYSLTWSSTNATSVSRVCNASGTGYTINDAPAVSGTSTGTASAAWVGYSSVCTWTATGTGGTATFNETMTTNAAPAGNGVTYIHTDGLGSPIARTDSAGQLVSRTRYEPYGLTAADATPTIGFTGHVNDADTGLVYMQQRYYDPVAGRFLSIDPVTTDGNTGSSFNRYSYANNSPYKYIDPDGREAADKWGDVFKAEMSNPQGERFEAFHTPALAVTGAMLIVPVAVAVGPAAVAAVRALPLQRFRAILDIVIELKKLTGTPIPNIPKITVITAQQVVKTITKTANTSKAIKPAAPPPPPPPPIPPPV